MQKSEWLMIAAIFLAVILINLAVWSAKRTEDKSNDR